MYSISLCTVLIYLYLKRLVVLLMCDIKLRDFFLYIILMPDKCEKFVSLSCKTKKKKAFKHEVGMMDNACVSRVFKSGIIIFMRFSLQKVECI